MLVNPSLAVGKISGNTRTRMKKSEGCLSVPASTSRSSAPNGPGCTGFDGSGSRTVEFEATGWFARCMQHEYDHLDGKLYVDRLKDRYARKARRGWPRTRAGACPD